MSRTMKSIITWVICLVVLAGVAVGGYFAYKATEKPRDPAPQTGALVVSHGELRDNAGKVIDLSQPLVIGNIYQVVNENEEGFSFKVNPENEGRETSITGVVGEAETLTIPGAMEINKDTYEVVSIEENAFAEATSLKNLYVADSIDTTSSNLSASFELQSASDVEGYDLYIKSVVVSFNANGGICETTSNELISGEVYGTLPVATRTGYTFDGWYTALENGTKVESSTLITATEDHTLYANWTAITYNVVLNENGGNNVEDLTYTVETTTLTLPTLTRDGYTFNGWFTAEVAGTKVESTDILSKLENQEYYAQWIANQFTVIFDSNKPASTTAEVVGTMENQTFTYDALQNLTANTYSLEYYNFAGWSTTANGSVEFTNGQSVKNLATEGSITLYAVWLADNERVITFEGNGVVVNPSTIIVTVGDAYGALPTLTRAGYTFDGWFTALENGTRVETTTTVPEGADHTLYAHWTINIYNVVLNENGGNNVEDLTYTVETTTLTLPTLTKANYVFTGWFTAEVGGTKVESTDILSKLENQEYYAQWTAITYNVVLNENGGNNVEDLTYTVETTTLTLPTLTRDGYTFNGWFTAEVGGTKVESTDILLKLENQEYYAQWTVITYNVVLNENGGSDVEDLTYTVETTTLTLPTLTKANYVFTGWFTAEVGGTKVESTDILLKLENQQYYAQWTPEEYDVILDENGGDLINDITYTIESEDITLPTPTRDGYTFIGWFGVKVVSGTTYYVGMDFLTTNNNALAYTSLDDINLNDSNKVVAIDCDVFAVNIGSGTLIAKWEEIVVLPATVEITFNANGGSVNPSTTTLTVGEAYGTLPTPTRAGYAFDGWYTAETNGDLIKSTTIVEDAENHTLYAHWSLKTYKITFLKNQGQAVDALSYTVESGNIVLPTTTRSGYTFIGWFGRHNINGVRHFVALEYFLTGNTEFAFSSLDDTNLNETTKIANIDSAKFAVNVGNFELIAKWEENTKEVEVIFDPQGGQIEKNSIIKIYKNAYGILPEPKRPYYTFAGWYTAIENGIKIERTTIIENENTHTLYALWTPTPSYFNEIWETLIKEDINGVQTGITKSNIKSINFERVMPTDEKYDSNNYCLVGSTTRKSITVNDSVLAYYYKDIDNLFHITFVSPLGETIYAPLGCHTLFDGLTLLEKVGFNNFNTTGVTTMYHMFQYCYNLTNMDLSNFNVDSVTRMENMFEGCHKLISVGDISQWNVSNVNNMRWMFASCFALTSLNGINEWDVSNVNNMEYLFYNCAELDEIEISNWDVGKTTSMSWMFAGCSSLASVDLSGWDVSSVTDMMWMFKGCESLKDIGDLSDWDVSLVTNMSLMFAGCSSLASVDLSKWVVSSVTDMNNMFYHCESLKDIGDLSDWDVSSVTNMSHMFNGCIELISLDLSGWDVSLVTSVSSMFNGCRALESLDLSGWELTSVTTTSNVFNECQNLTEIKAPKTMKAGRTLTLPTIEGKKWYVEGSSTPITEIDSSTVGKTLQAK